MAQLRHTPHIADIEAQIRWEMQSIERGIERAKEAMEKAKLGDTEVGTAILRRLVPLFVDHLKVRIDEAREAILESQRGRPQLWWWMVQLLEPEALAVVTIKSIFSASVRDTTFNRPVTGVSATIQSSLMLQLEYEDWQEAESKKPKDENQFLKFMRSTKNVDAKTYKRFTEKLGKAREQRWDRTTGIAFGAWLLHELAQSAPDWFTIKSAPTRPGQTEMQIVLSEEARQLVCDITEQTELNRPLNLPMLCPPADWRIA